MLSFSIVRSSALTRGQSNSNRFTPHLAENEPYTSFPFATRQLAKIGLPPDANLSSYVLASINRMLKVHFVGLCFSFQAILKVIQAPFNKKSQPKTEAR